MDDPDMGEGFIWGCCQKDGDDKGCKLTKHKAKSNIILKDPEAVDGKKSRKNGETEPHTSKRIKLQK